MYSENTLQTLETLRDPANMSWIVVPMIGLLCYVYYKELDHGHISRVLAAFAFFGMDIFNELWNSLVAHATGFAPVWGVAGPSIFTIFIGWNIEIVFGFMLVALAATMTLPKDPKMKILGVNNRVLLAIVNSILCVCAENLLHAAGLLVWEWPWWNAQNPWLIFLLGYMPFFVVAFWVYDMTSTKKKLTALGSIYGLNALFLLGLASFGWV